MADLITVIVPIYNIEKYAAKCIESITKQSYKELEIFLVDDGSTDKSGEICDYYAERDGRIKVIHKENGGLSDARNAALEKANGRYITFIDGDDFVDADYVSCLYDALTRHGADISTCKFRYVDENGSVSKDFSEKKLLVLDQKQALYRMLDHKKLKNSAWAKLYKAELFDDVRYPKGKIFEDVATTYKLILKSEKIVCAPEATYNYLQRAGSIYKQEFKPSRLDAIEFGEQMAFDIVKIYPELRKIADCRRFDSYIAVLRLIKGTDEKEVRARMLSMLKAVRRTVLFYPPSGFNRKALALASYFGVIL